MNTMHCTGISPPGYSRRRYGEEGKNISQASHSYARALRQEQDQGTKKGQEQQKKKSEVKLNKFVKHMSENQVARKQIPK